MSRYLNILIRFLALGSLMFVLEAAVNAQVRPPTPPSSISADKSRPDSDEQAPTQLDYDMRARRAIKYAEKEHQESVSRAREASELGSDLATAFKKNRCLSADDLKKLDKLEKLTKKIRSEVGAEDDECELENKPHDLAEAVESVAKVSASLGDKITKTPRRVVSAAIIDESNVLLELIRILRGFAAQ